MTGVRMNRKPYRKFGRNSPGKKGSDFFSYPPTISRDKDGCPKCDKQCDCACKKDGSRGCFDKSGNFKPEHEKAFGVIMDEIIEHLTGTAP